MLRLSTSLLTIMLVSSSSAAQDTAVFRTGATVIEITAVALDNDGNPVTDLRKEEILLRDSGREREIAFFRFDGNGRAQPSATSVSLPEGFVTNRPEYLPNAPMNFVAIVMDLINTAPTDQSSAYAQLRKYLQTIPQNTHVALYRFSDDEPLRTVREATSDVQVLRAGLSELRIASRREFATAGNRGQAILGGDCYIQNIPTSSSRPSSSRAPERELSGKPGAVAMAHDTELRALLRLNSQIRDARLGKTLASLEALGTRLSGIPGRKSVIWITGGMPLRLRESGHNYEPDIRTAARRLAGQGVAVYPVDAKGLCRQGDTSTDEGPDGSHDAPQMVFASLNVVAETTGGRLWKNTNDPMVALSGAGNDHRATYAVGFYASETNPSRDEWHRIQMSVKRRGVELRHREGYLAVASAQPRNLPQEEWAALASASIGSSGVRFNARSERLRDNLQVLLQIAAEDLYFREHDGRMSSEVEIGIIQQGAGGRMVVRSQTNELTLKNPTNRTPQETIELSLAWTPIPDTSEIRVIVRDRYSNRWGMLNVPVAPSP